MKEAASSFLPSCKYIYIYIYIYIVDTTLENMRNIKSYFFTKLNIRSSWRNIFEVSSFWRYSKYLLMSPMNIMSPSWVITSSCSTLKLDQLSFTETSVSIYKSTYSYIIENWNFNSQRWDSPRLFCNFSFLRFSQSWLYILNIIISFLWPKVTHWPPTRCL